MRGCPAPKATESRPVRALKGGITCDQCKGGLASFIEEVLEEGRIPKGSLIPVHLEGCPLCSQTYIHLIDLMTAPQVKALQDSLLDPSLSAGSLEGLLQLWQMQLGACNRVEDLKGTAVGLSVIGMIRRQLRDIEEARLVHELALQTAEEGHDPLSRAISHADLGYIALRNDRAREALDHLTRAYQYAARLEDGESQARILVLLGDAWRMRRNLEEARRKYEGAKTQAKAADYRLALGTRPLGELIKLRILSLAAATESCWQETKENWKRLRTEIQVAIAEMRASFRNWPPGLQPQPVPVRYRRGEGESWSLSIPEEEGRVGYDVKLTVFSPSGERADLDLTLTQQPGGGPIEGAEVMFYDDVGLPIERPRVTDEEGSMALQLWPGRYDIAITYKGSGRDIQLGVVTSPTIS